MPHIVECNFAESTLHNRPDYQPHHLVEKTVTIKIDRDTGLAPLHPYRIYCPDGGFLRLAAVRGKGREIVGADKQLHRRLQPGHVQWRGNMPGATVFER